MVLMPTKEVNSFTAVIKMLSVCGIFSLIDAYVNYSSLSRLLKYVTVSYYNEKILFMQHRKAEPTGQTKQTDKKSPEKSGFDFLGDFVLAEGLEGGAGQHRKAEPTGQTRQTDKKSPEKSGFDFLGDFVLAEGLGGGARQRKPLLFSISVVFTYFLSNDTRGSLLQSRH